MPRRPDPGNHPTHDSSPMSTASLARPTTRTTGLTPHSTLQGAYRGHCAARSKSEAEVLRCHPAVWSFGLSLATHKDCRMHSPTSKPPPRQYLGIRRRRTQPHPRATAKMQSRMGSPEFRTRIETSWDLGPGRWAMNRGLKSTKGALTARSSLHSRQEHLGSALFD